MTYKPPCQKPDSPQSFISRQDVGFCFVVGFDNRRSRFVLGLVAIGMVVLVLYLRWDLVQY